MSTNIAIRQNKLTLHLRVRYGECDAQGVVFNARYADYADIAATEYMRMLIGDFQRLIESGFDNQVVSYHIDWKSSAKFDDVLSLKVCTSHIGNSSFSFEIACTKRTSTGSFTPVALINITYVMVDAKSLEKRPIPETLKDAFARPFERVVNQAG